MFRSSPEQLINHIKTHEPELDRVMRRIQCWILDDHCTSPSQVLFRFGVWNPTQASLDSTERQLQTLENLGLMKQVKAGESWCDYLLDQWVMTPKGREVYPPY